MFITTQTIITAGGVFAAVTAFVAMIWKLFKWIDHQKEQDQEIKRLEAKFDREVEELRKKHEKDQSGIQEEQTLVVYGLLACLKGLAEQGCDGPVSEAIDKIEKHINKKAHEQQ